MGSAALGLQPTGNWDGNDGEWSTFQIDIGSSPPQTYHILPSTLGSQIWLPTIPMACGGTNNFSSDCPARRGVVDPIRSIESSPSWNPKGKYVLTTSPSLWVDDGGDMGCEYGLDGVSLHTIDSSANTGSQKQVIAAYSSSHWWLGLLGLGISPTPFISESATASSLLVSLKENGSIPSLSFGYTAGSSYRQDNVGSLTLGGYDASRRSPSALDSITVEMDQDSGSPMIQLWDITAKFGPTAGQKSLMPRAANYSMFLDSSISQLWLPGEACELFADAFGLKPGADNGFYMPNSTLRETLRSNNASISFTVGASEGADSAVEIEFPFEAFDLIAGRPDYDKDNVSYFPIRRAANDSQYILGRAFFQEAYLTVDWERNNLTLGKARPVSKDIVADVQAISSVPDPENQLSPGAVAGIVISCFAIASAILFGGWWIRRHKRQERRRKESVAASTIGTIGTVDAEKAWDKSELMSDNGGSIRKPKRERGGSDELDPTAMTYLSIDEPQSELMSTQVWEAQGDEVAHELNGEAAARPQQEQRVRSSVHELE